MVNEILKDKHVKRWHENVSRGRGSTGSSWLRILNRVLSYMEMTPKQIVALNKDELEELIADYISKREKAVPQRNGSMNMTIHGSTIASELKVLRSFLSWSGVNISQLKKYKIKGVNNTIVSTREQIPTQDQLRQVLNTSKPRVRATISLISFSGIRLEVIGTFNGENGLRIRDIPSIKIDDGKVEFTEIPAMIKVSSELSKTGNSYFSFIGGEGCQNLKAYLDSRFNNGEKLSEDSPVIATLDGQKFIYTSKLGELIRQVMRSSGLPQRPYVWRSYFASRSMLAEKKGLSRDSLRFLMGHTGTMLDRYTLHKVLSEDMVNELRTGYESALEYLETTFEPKKARDFFLESYRQLAIDLYSVPEEELIGKSTEEISEIMRKHSTISKDPLLDTVLDLINVPYEQAKLLSRTQLIDLLIPSLMIQSSGGQAPKKQLIVKKSEVPSYLERGYSIEMVFDETSVIMLEPSGNHN